MVLANANAGRVRREKAHSLRVLLIWHGRLDHLWRPHRSCPGDPPFVLNRPYPSAPFSTLHLFNRGQDVGFQRSIDNSPRKRHHVRFWGLSIERAEKTLDTAAFWLGSTRPADTERALWVGAVTKDVGFSLTRLSFQITHATDADTNAEREFLVQELTKHGAIGPVRYYRPGKRSSLGAVNRYISDGLVAVAVLRQQ